MTDRLRRELLAVSSDHTYKFVQVGCKMGQIETNCGP